MKKVLLLFVVCFASCAVQRYSEDYFIADFRPYTEEGFTISPLANHASTYRPIAAVSVEFTLGVDNSVAIKRDGQGQGDLYSASTTPGNWRHPSHEEMLSKLVDYAKSLGANGLLDYRFEVIRNEKTNGIIYYRLSGFAVEL